MKICTQCGTIGNGKSFTRGSFFIELLLWLCFIIPGIIYSIWRLTTRKNVCVACKADALVPIDSPIGKKFAGEEYEKYKKYPVWKEIELGVRHWVKGKSAGE